MKKILTILICLCLFVSCAPVAQEQTSLPTTTVQPTPEPTPERDKIGLSLPEQTEYYKTLAEYAEKNANDKGYDLLVRYEDTSSQNEQVIELVNLGVKGLLVVPSDPNALFSAFTEAENSGVHIVSLLESVNAKYATLISPDYNDVGQKIARLCREAVKDLDIQNPEIYALEGEADSFTMQLIHNGLISELQAQNDDEISIEFVGAKHFSEQNQATLEGFDPSAIGTANIIFAENDAMAEAFVNIAPNANPAIITIGSTAEVLQSVKEGTYYASIIIGPKQFADEGISELVSLISGGTPKVYSETPTGVASESTVNAYMEQNLDFSEPIDG